MVQIVFALNIEGNCEQTNEFGIEIDESGPNETAPRANKREPPFTVKTEIRKSSYQSSNQ
jgi:hypothetical protein